MKKVLTTLILLLVCLIAYSQVTYTAKDVVQPYTGYFRPGANLGYNPPWDDAELADIAAGNPALGIQGVGVKAIRPALYETVLDIYGYDLRVPTFQHYDNLGLKDNTCIVGFPVDWHRDLTEYCPGEFSELFGGMYLPIWDNGENGTPVNDDNYYALYLYKTVTLYKDYIKFWEIWNEPGFDYTYATGWLPPGEPGNWWENDPNPCDYKLRAPIYHYVRMLRISWEIIKTYDPDSYVAIAGVGYQSFIDAILRNTDNPIDGSVTPEHPHGGGAYFDVMGFHSYPHFDGALKYWDSSINNFVFQRHSDAAADGIPRRQGLWQEVLGNYGFDGNTYPEKEWIITEINLPRRQFGEYIGSQEAQINFIMKAVVACMENDIRQMHVFNLGDETTEANAYNEFNLFGLYQKLDGTPSYSQVVNPEGVAYKTTSDQLFETVLDPVRTSAMNLPSNIRGGAFRDSNGKYTYMLWAKTTIDMSENAFATYSFPANFNINQLNKKEWNYAQSQFNQVISSQGVALTGRPIFLRDVNDDDTAGVDTTAPTVTLTTSNPIVSAPFQISINFSEPVTGLSLADFTVSNGTLSNLSGFGANYTLTVTPITIGIINITLPANSTVDAASNGSLVSNTLMINYSTTQPDNTPPAVFLSTPNTTVSGSFTVNVNFDEPVFGLASSDFSINNGSISNLTGMGQNYSFTITPTMLGTVSVFLPANTTNDLAGNENTISNTLVVNYEGMSSGSTDIALNMTVDNTQPSLYNNVTFTLTATNTGADAASNIVVDFPFPTGLVWVDANTSFGVFNVFSRQWEIPTLAVGQSATMNLTLYTLVDNATITAYAQVTAASPLDADSTPGNGISPNPIEDDEAAATIIIGSTNGGTTDTTPPAVSLTTGTTNVTGPFVVNVNFTEDINGFSLSDLTITNGTASNLSGAGSFYSFTLTPSVAGTSTILLPSNTTTDNAGNGNTASNTLVVNYSTNGGGSGNIDLALNLSVDNSTFDIFETVGYTLIVSNTSNTTATGVEVSFPIPDGMVHSSQSTTNGDYFSWTGSWVIGTIAPNSSATLNLDLFTMNANGPFTNFAQVVQANENDIDSTPNNGFAPNANEDDEAVVTILPNNGNSGGGTNDNPVVTLSAPSQVNGTFTVTITVSENVTGFTLGDILVSNGISYGFTGSGQNYSVTISPYNFGLVTITVPSGVTFDIDGNGNDLSNVLTVTYGSIASNGADLELNLSVVETQYTIFDFVNYTLTITNTGNLDATGVTVDFPIPDGMVHASDVTSEGAYYPWDGSWEIGNIPAGGLEVLELRLFTMTTGSPFTVFAQVKTMDGTDLDSTPNNWTCIGQANCQANEDDEATVVVFPSSFSTPNNSLIISDQQKELNLSAVFPNPAVNELYLMISAKEATTIGFTIYDLTGRVKGMQEVSLEKGYNQVPVDIDQLPSGLYHILFDTTNKHTPIRFIKQRL